MSRQKQSVKEKLGREPGPDDPVLFDPDTDAPQAMNKEKIDKVMIEAMVKAGLDRSYIYAHKKTGFLATVDAPE